MHDFFRTKIGMIVLLFILLMNLLVVLTTEVPFIWFLGLGLATFLLLKTLNHPAPRGPSEQNPSK